MADRQPLNATFFAFKKREQNGVLLRASIGFGIGMILLVAAFGALAWTMFRPVIDWYVEAMASAGDPQKAAEIAAPPMGMLGIAPAYMLYLFLFFVLFAAYEAACHRWMVRGETGGGLLGLNLGADTWRVYATYWVWFGLAVGAYIACIVAIVGGALAFAGQSDGGPGGAIVGVVVLLVFLALIYAIVRLAPAAATSVGRGQFSFFKAWTVTSGRFWALFGAFVLLTLMYIVFSMIAGGMLFGLVFAGAFSGLDWAAAGQQPEQFSRAYMDALSGLMSNPATLVVMILYYLVAGAVGILFYALFFGVNARAVQAALEEGKIERAAA